MRQEKGIDRSVTDRLNPVSPFVCNKSVYGGWGQKIGKSGHRVIGKTTGTSLVWGRFERDWVRFGGRKLPKCPERKTKSET
jgi:hypothetical protein